MATIGHLRCDCTNESRHWDRRGSAIFGERIGFLRTWVCWYALEIGYIMYIFRFLRHVVSRETPKWKLEFRDKRGRGDGMHWDHFEANSFEEMKSFSFALSLSAAAKVNEDARSPWRRKASGIFCASRNASHWTGESLFLELTYEALVSLTSTETKNNHLITKFSCLWSWLCLAFLACVYFQHRREFKELIWILREISRLMSNANRKEKICCLGN